VAVYTPISEAELAAFLDGYELGPACAFEGIVEGVENSNFKLQTPAGRFVLTVFEKRTGEADLPYCLGLMSRLAARGFACPTPAPDRSGAVIGRLRGKPAAIVTFMAGEPVDAPTPEHCREAGAALARLHLGAAGFPLQRANALGQPVWAPMFEPLRGGAERLASGLARAVADDLERLAGAWPHDLPSGPIHADLFPDNVFFAQGRFAAAIDFYFACDDALAYDLAVCLNSWAFDARHRFDPAAALALVEGYERERPLGEAERAALPVLAHGAAMRFFLTRLADWEATPPGAQVRPKSPLEYAAKLAAHRSGEVAALLDGKRP